jgi:hypothetical protein
VRGDEGARARRRSWPRCSVSAIQPNAPSESLDDALDGSPDPEGYDRNDTAAVAAHIDGGARPNDAPLTPVGEDTKPLLTKVTPKRKKAASPSEVQ